MSRISTYPIDTVVDTADLLIGSSEYSSTAYTSDMISIIAGQFTLSTQSVLEVQHYSGATKATDGFGVSNNIDSKSEIYTVAEFWKERS